LQNCALHQVQKLRKVTQKTLKLPQKKQRESNAPFVGKLIKKNVRDILIKLNI
jgi:hypothetical protein